MNLAGGADGNLQTVRYMSRIAHQESKNIDIRMKAMEIVRRAGCRSHDELCEALAIGRWVQSKVRYVKDPTGQEWLMHPSTLLDQISIGRGQGDCDDMSFLIATLLLAIGHQPCFKMVRWARAGGHFDHIYVTDFVASPRHGKKVTIALDAILKDRPIGSEIPARSFQEVRV